MNKLFSESVLGKQLESYSSRLGSLIRLQFGLHNNTNTLIIESLPCLVSIGRCEGGRLKICVELSDELLDGLFRAI